MKIQILFASIALVAFVPAIGWSQSEKGKKNAENRLKSGKGERPGVGKPGGPMGGGAPLGALMQRLPLVIALDTDQDGVLSASEIENASKSLLKLDQDGDGKLSSEEMRPNPSEFNAREMIGGTGDKGMAGAGPAMLAKMFDNRDKDGDGKLTGDEIPERLRERTAAIDTNADGSIQKSEIQEMAERLGGGKGPLGKKDRSENAGGSGVKPKKPPE